MGLVTTSLTHKVNLYRNLHFGYRQDTIPTFREADRAGQKQLFDVNCLFCNKGIWGEKVFSLFFLILLLVAFLVKLLILSVSIACPDFYRDATQKTIMTYFYKAFRQNMQRKPSDKFLVRERHLFLEPVLTVIFVRKSYVLIVNALYAVVANGNLISLLLNV
jgi:hypothetical protein